MNRRIRGFVRAGILFAPMLLVALVLGAFREAPALQWESIGPDGGRVDGFAQSRANPERMFVLLYGQGIWRSEDRGASWNRVDVGLPSNVTYTAIAASSNDPEIVLVASDSGDDIFRSTNGGIDWTSIPVASGLGQVQDMEFDPWSGRNGLLTASGGGSVYKSTDAGETWSLSNTGFTAGPVQIAFHPTVPGTVLIGSSGGVFRSTNGGASWTPSNMGGNTSARHISFCRTDPSRVWAVGHPQWLLRSDDGGVTFVGAGAPNFPDHCISMEVAADPINADHLLVAFNDSHCTGDCTYFGFVVRSTNGGANWENYFAPSGDHSWSEFVTGLEFDVDDESSAYLSLGDGYGTVPIGFLRTTNHGETWSSWMSGLSGRTIARVDHDGNGKVYAHSDGRDGLWSAPAPGAPWLELPPSGLSVYDWIDTRANDGVQELLEEVGGHYSDDTFHSKYRRSTDGGLSWSSTVGFPVEGFVPIQEATAMVSDLTGQTVYVWLSNDSSVYRSTNGGSSFGVVHEGILAFDAEIDPTNPQRVFSIQWEFPGSVHMTTDGGSTWASRSSGLPSAIGIELLIDPSNPDHLAAVYRTAGVFETQNAGLSWSTVPLPGYSAQVLVDADWDPASNRFFLAIESGGVYISGAGIVSDGLASPPASILYEPVHDKLLLGTHYASVALLDVGSAVAAPIGEAAAYGFAIRARPNPSRGPFEFDVEIAKDTEVRVSIVDVQGRRVSVPFQGRLDQGAHTVEWRGRLDSGKQIAPGIYFARLEAGGRIASTRLVLLTK